MKTYTGFGSRVPTPQGQPIFGREAEMVKNNAGGFVFKLDRWSYLERFLLMGTEGGTFYVQEKPLTLAGAKNVVECAEADGRRTVDAIVHVSDKGLAPKNDPALFALAIASSAKSADTRAYALAALPEVARIPTHLMHFLTYVKQFRGLGRGLKTALGNWYNVRELENLAHAVVKYQSRDGVSNRDILRLAHPKTAEPVRNAIYRWIVDGLEGFTDRPQAYETLPAVIREFEALKGETSITKVVNSIHKYNLTREMIPTEMLGKPEVQEALLERMPPTALIRNLGNLSKSGLLKPLSQAEKLVVSKIHDKEAFRKGRVHPITILIALKQYASGQGLRGGGEWTASQAVVDALDDAFYDGFTYTAPTGKNYVFGIDVSGSMGSPCNGTPLRHCEVSAALALAAAKLEKNYYIMGFSTHFVDLGITPKMRLDAAAAKTVMYNFGGTDCALPAAWAMQNKIEADVFVVITDNETWAGRIHPSQALQAYRQQSGRPARQVVLATAATDFTIADPNDGGMLDIAGFSADVPAVINNFVRPVQP